MPGAPGRPRAGGPPDRAAAARRAFAPELLGRVRGAPPAPGPGAPAPAAWSPPRGDPSGARGRWEKSHSPNGSGGGGRGLRGAPPGRPPAAAGRRRQLPPGRLGQVVRTHDRSLWRTRLKLAKASLDEQRPRFEGGIPLQGFGVATGQIRQGVHPVPGHRGDRTSGHRFVTGQTVRLLRPVRSPRPPRPTSGRQLGRLEAVPRPAGVGRFARTPRGSRRPRRLSGNRSARPPGRWSGSS